MTLKWFDRSNSGSNQRHDVKIHCKSYLLKRERDAFQVVYGRSFTSSNKDSIKPNKILEMKIRSLEY